MSRMALIAMLLVPFAGTASAQSLADVARQEAHRRMSIVAAGRVYRNADLPAPPAIEAQPAAAGLSPLPEPGTQPAAPSPVEAPSFDDRDERYWRDRGSALNRRLDSTRADLAAVNAHLGTLAGPSQERTLTEAARRTVEADQRALEDDLQELQAQASAARVPLVWLR